MKYFQRQFKAMGTLCEIQLFADSNLAAKKASQAVIQDVNRLEQLYSRYRADSFLSQINKAAAAGGCIEVDSETAGLLNYAETCYQQSDGLFDISSGLLRKAWRFDKNKLPESNEIEQLLGYIGWHRLQWQEPKISFTQPGMEIDFGGIVKEYAVDRAAVVCNEHGIRHGVVNLGGDIKVIGPREDDTPWRIGIRHPHQQGIVDTLLLSHGALASSGDYERCITIEDKRYGHVLNPISGWPVRYLAAVSVVSELCVVAGSAATIAMLKEEAGPEWLAQLGLPHLWVDVHGNIGGTLDLFGHATMQ